jgi:acyl-CoA synthetase (AMP-forming)/AMP-acid ligase II
VATAAHGAAVPDRVALVLPNSIEFHIAYFAALKARAAPALLGSGKREYGHREA